MLRLQTATKDHKCDDCGKPIPKGTKYWRQQDDEPEDFNYNTRKTHQNCEQEKQNA